MKKFPCDFVTFVMAEEYAFRSGLMRVSSGNYIYENAASGEAVKGCGHPRRYRWRHDAWAHGYEEFQPLRRR
jgi:hypothetical protein